MAKATFSQPPVRSRSTPLLLLAIGLAILVGLRLIFSGPAVTLINGLFWFLEYYAGVGALVALSISVILGLVATDRIVLTVRHRILLQAAHRVTAMASMAFLGIHVALKILEGHATFVDVVVPFLSSHRVIFIGLGTIAGYFMVIVTWTGIIRGRFAGSAHPGIWRALHASAYLAWPFALVHGLQSGRPAKTWVTVSYLICVVFVVLALLVRVVVTWGKRMRAPKATTSGTIRPIGRPVPRPEPELIAPPPPPRRRPSPPRWEPALSSGGHPHEESAPYGPRGPAGRGRRSRMTRTGDARPRPGVDMTDSRIPRYPGYLPDEPVTAQPAATWSGHDGVHEGSNIADSQEMPRLTFLDESPDESPPAPKHARPPAWEEPDPYHTGTQPAVGRHSGEYETVGQRTGGYRPAWQAVLEEAPAYGDDDGPGVRYLDERADAPVSAPPVEPPSRSRRRHRAVPELTETPNDLPATRKAAVVLTDEEFWAHMRGDALR